jgi:hypothetical protein
MTADVTMGGGPAREIIQFALPWPEPQEIFAHFRQKYPHIELRYFNLKFTTNIVTAADVPAGI